MYHVDVATGGVERPPTASGAESGRRRREAVAVDIGRIRWVGVEWFEDWDLLPGEERG